MTVPNGSHTCVHITNFIQRRIRFVTISYDLAEDRVAPELNGGWCQQPIAAKQ